jgi:hypothetical protein
MPSVAATVEKAQQLPGFVPKKISINDNIYTYTGKM